MEITHPGMCIEKSLLSALYIRDGRPAGKGGFPAPPRKNDQNCGEVAGQNKGLYLNFLQKKKLMMEQYHNTEHEWTMPNPAYQ